MRELVVLWAISVRTRQRHFTAPLYIDSIWLKDERVRTMLRVPNAHMCAFDQSLIWIDCFLNKTKLNYLNKLPEKIHECTPYLFFIHLFTRNSTQNEKSERVFELTSYKYVKTIQRKCNKMILNCIQNTKILI